MELKPVDLITTPKGENVIDFGQNFVGFIRIELSEPKGTVIRFDHSEVLDKKGNFLNNIIGVNKEQTDIFVCSDDKDEVFQPYFSFHGFRYVRIIGMKPELGNIKGIVISSDMEKLSEFSSSNNMLNKLYSNTLWSQFGNMVSIPTDCPQRERAGWAGDIQVYAPTASYNQDMSAFLIRWLENVEVEQLPDGQIPIVIPFSASYKNVASMQGKGITYCSAGWSEACIIVPYTLYSMYGFKEVLKKHYPMMIKWIEYVRKCAENNNPRGFEKKHPNVENNKYLWNTGWHYGDWMIPSLTKGGAMGAIKGARATKDIIASIYYAYSTSLMSEIAKILGREEDARKYSELSDKIKNAIAETYVSDEGIIKPDLQGIYACALWYGVVPKDKEQKIVERLKHLIEQNGYCLDTGFLGTPILLDVLVKYGLRDVAFKILYQENSPSWFYEIKKGATTIWESWDGIKPDGKVGNLSYNHYAFGCVFDWIYRYISGIKSVEPGYKKISIKPEPDDTLTHAKSSFKSAYGEIVSNWKKENGYFKLQVKIPCNTSAIVVLPNGEQHEVGSGTYDFSCAEM
jgi:alpha-L-rhamnosidase